MNGKPLSRRAFVKVLGLAVGSAGLASLSGCRDTDTLIEVIHADWATEVDTNTPIKTYKNVPNSNLTSSSLPKLKDSDVEAVDEKVELPSYDADAPENGEAMQQKKSEQTPKEQDNTQSDRDEQDSGSGSGKEVAGDSGEKGGSGTGEGTAEDTTQYGKKSATISENGEIGSYPQSDVSAAPEMQGAVIAFGEMANITLMLGGRGSLFACDDTFLEAAQQYYDPAVLTGVGYGLLPDYSKGGTTMKAKKFSKLLEALEGTAEADRPKYLIYDAAIGCPLTDDQSEALQKKYGIQTLYFSLKTVALLKNAMNYIQKILSGFGAKQVYEAYWEFHDDLLDALASRNGGVAAWTAGEGTSNMCFKDGSTLSGSKVMDQDQTLWTLVIDGWDRGVSYDSAGYYEVSADSGLGVSTLGWAWSPINYYLQCGGVINNAAARYQVQHTFSSRKTYRRYVWQMHRAYGLPSDDTLKGNALKGEDAIDANAGDDGLAEILMLAQGGEFGLGKLGDVRRFPAVIVTDPVYKDYLEADRGRSKGAYAAHYLEAGATPNNPEAAMGMVHRSSGAGKGALWRSYVGYTGDSEPASAEYSGSKAPYDVLVNPHGVYSDWAAGSVESMLEAAWACAVFRGGSVDAGIGSTGYGSTAAEVVSTFYQTFYGKAPSSSTCSKVLSGGYAHGA